MMFTCQFGMHNNVQGNTNVWEIQTFLKNGSICDADARLRYANETGQARNTYICIYVYIQSEGAAAAVAGLTAAEL